MNHSASGCDASSVPALRQLLRPDGTDQPVGADAAVAVAQRGHAARGRCRVRRRGRRPARSRCRCRGPWRRTGRPGLDSGQAEDRLVTRRSLVDGSPSRPTRSFRHLGDQQRVLPVEPVDPRVGAEPGQLPAGELPGGDDGVLDGLVAAPLRRRGPRGTGSSRWPGTLSCPGAGPAASSRRTSSSRPASTMRSHPHGQAFVQQRPVHVQPDLDGGLRSTPRRGM